MSGRENHWKSYDLEKILRKPLEELHLLIFYSELVTGNRLLLEFQRSDTLVSYPNFVRGLLLDDMQPLVSRFEILGVLCCTINEVSRRVRDQKEAS